MFMIEGFYPSSFLLWTHTRDGCAALLFGGADDLGGGDDVEFSVVVGAFGEVAGVVEASSGRR